MAVDMDTGETPLSDAMTAVIRSQGEQRDYESFLRSFVMASVGVELVNVPNAAGRYRVARGDSLAWRLCRAPDGSVLVRACADPAVFRAKFDHAITAEMIGHELLDAVPLMEGLEGVLVCSAVSAHSIPLRREGLRQILRDHAHLWTPWWKRWLL
jgi:hypothetical protein